MDWRQLVLVTHRWLGLATGLVLAIAGTTGAVLVWREQMEFLEPLGRYASPLHERLAAGRIGYWIVVVSTGIAVILELGGLVLWWKRKTIWIRRGGGLWRICFDLHHMVGVILLPLMVILAVTGFAMAFVDGTRHPELYRLLATWHKGHFPVSIKVLYTVATLAFAVQGLTGLVMWWKPASIPIVRERANRVRG
jgi:uncharacterized iron-regulated membrane protein